MARPEPTPDRRTTDRPETSERRERANLRELCDEVLASHRTATERDVITDDDRAEADRVLAQVAPLMVR